MKNNVFSFSGKIIFFCFFSLAIFLTGCENFLTGSDFREKLETEVQYTNAESNTMLVQAVENTGTTVPAGNVQVKIGYEFEVKFSENPEYCLINWIAENEENEILGTDIVSFSDPESLTTKVTLKENIPGIRIIPNCVKRITFANEPSPKWESKGVSRDRPVTVQFSKKPNINSFIFSEEEIPADAITKKDSSENIYAYELNGRTFFKNISITNEADISIAEYFLAPVIKDNLLIIETDKSHLIEFEAGETYKTIKITISSEIQDENNISMNIAKSWNYRITEFTDDKANIIFPQGIGTNAEEGKVSAVSKEYSIGQMFSLAFTENANYQFVKWSYDSSIVSIADENNISTTAIIKEISDGSEIKAICAPRLRVIDFSPVTNKEIPTVSKNSSITITFNKSIPCEPEDLGQLKNIGISIGGTPVRGNFSEPEVTDNTITFKALSSDLLDVQEGQTKLVTVSIPSDFYYKLEDGAKVSYGDPGISFDYRIDFTTLTKAEVTFTATENSGIISPSGSGNQYSVGQEIPLTFDVASGYVFSGWTVTSGGVELEESKIKIADKTSPNTKLIINDVVTAVTVKAHCFEKIVLSNNFAANTVYPKDSDITINFNKAPDSSCSELLNKIKISINGSNVDHNFTERKLDDKSIIIKNSSLLDFNGSEATTVTVTVPAIFFYRTGTNEVKMEDEYTFTYLINSTTNAKAKINFGIIDGETGAPINSNTAGSINFNSYEEFDIGQTLPLNITVDKNYQFYGWSVVDVNNNEVPYTTLRISSTEANTNLILNKECENIKINAVIYKRPVIIKHKPEPLNPNDEFAKDTPILVEFGHVIPEDEKDNLSLSYSYGNINKDTFFNSTITSDGNNSIISLISNKFLPLENAYETVSVMIPHDKIYYLAKDNKTKIFMSEEDFSWSYRINNKTTENVNIRFIVDENSNSTGYKVNNSLLSTGAKETFNIEQEISLQYPLTEGYGFEGWKIESATSGYTVEPAGYVKHGEIHVKNGEKDYLVLYINEDDSARASIKVFNGISNGSESYGITIFSKDILIPVIEKTYLEYTASGIPQDTDIKISSNYPLSLEDFYDSINNKFKNIRIQAGLTNLIPDEDMFHYFTKPELSEDKKTLIIPTNKKNLLIPVDSAENSKDITITLNLTKISLAADIQFSSDWEYTYRVNKNRDSIAPEIKSLTVYKADANGVAGTAVSSNVFSNWSKDDYKTNWTSQIVVECQGYDAGSGIKELYVKEKLEKTTSGTDNTSPVEYKYTVGEDSFVKGDGNLYSAKIPVVFETPDDGLLKLELGVKDYAGNLSAVQTFYVIKDTIVNDTRFSATGTLSSKTRKDVNGIDTFDFSFNSKARLKDFYYDTGNISSQYYGYNKVTNVYWGYDKNHLSEIKADAQGNYVISKEAYKEVVIRLTIQDELQNTLEKIVLVPPKSTTTKFIGKQELSDKMAVYASKYFPSEAQTSTTQWCYVDMQNGIISNWEHNLNLSEGNLVYNGFSPIGDHTIDDFNTIYNIYTYSSNEYGIWDLYGCNSDLFVHYQNVDNPNTPPSKDELPYKINLTFKSIKQNETNVKLNAEFINQDGNVYIPELKPEYSYLIKAVIVNSDKEYWCDISDVSFPSGKKYKIYTALNDRNGNVVVSDDYTDLDLSKYDNTPPLIDIRAMNLLQYPYSSGAVRMSFFTFPTDNSDLYNKNGVYYLKYYFILGKNEISRSAEEIERYPAKTTTFTKINGKFPEYILIPFDDMPEDYYNLYVKFEDNSELHNYTFVNALCNNISENVTPSAYSNETKTAVYASSEYQYYTLDYYDEVWKGMNNNSNYCYHSATEKEGKFELDLSTLQFYKDKISFNDIKNKFIKIAPRKNAGLLVYTTTYGNSIIVYPAYYLGEVTCNRKNVMTGGLNGIEVISDAPTLVHTMYCSKNLGSDTSKDAITWVTKGIETGVKTSDVSFTYDKKNLESVPKGSYYTTVVHFADGTSIMTDVKQK